MTVARVSQVAVEVLRTNTDPAVRVSQVAVEVLRINTGTHIRVSQVAVEVLRPTYTHRVVQFKHGAGNAALTLSATLDTTPTPGNLLIAFVFPGTAGEGAITWNTTGWFVIDHAVSFDSSGNPGVALGRYVQSGDTATLPGFASSSPAFYYCWTVQEISGVAGNWDDDYISSAGARTAGSVNNISGTRRTTVGDVFGVCGYAKYNEGSIGTTPSGWSSDINTLNAGAYGSYGCGHRRIDTAGTDVSATFVSASAGSGPGSCMFVLLSHNVPTTPTVVRTRVFPTGNAALGAIPFGKPKTDDLILRCIAWGQGVSNDFPAIDTAAWTEYDTQVGTTYKMMSALYRYAGSGDSHIVPAATASGVANYNFSFLVELSGVDTTFANAHTDTSSGFIPGGTAFPDTTTAIVSASDDSLGFSFYALYSGTAGHVTATGDDLELIALPNYGAYGAAQLVQNFLVDTESFQPVYSHPSESARNRAYIQSIFGAASGPPPTTEIEVYKLVSYAAEGFSPSAASLPKLVSYVIAETEVESVYKLQAFALITEFPIDEAGLSKLTGYSVSNLFPQNAESVTKVSGYLVTYPQTVPAIYKTYAQAVAGAPHDQVSIQKITAYVVKRPAPPPDPVVVLYPTTLPNPRVADVTASERRRLPQTSTTFEATAKSRDRISRQNLTWTLSPEQAEIFDEWWENDLDFGGKWFEATWPSPRGFITIQRKCIDTPRWTHIGNGAFEISVACEIRDIKVH